MPGPEKRLIGEHLQRRLTSCFEQPTETVLPRPLESTLYRAGQDPAAACGHGRGDELGAAWRLARRHPAGANAPLRFRPAHVAAGLCLNSPAVSTLGLPPWCGGDRSEYHAAARMVIASMLARASTGVR